MLTPDNPLQHLDEMPFEEALSHVQFFYQALCLEHRLMSASPYASREHLAFLADVIHQMETAMPALKEKAQA